MDIKNAALETVIKSLQIHPGFKKVYQGECPFLKSNTLDALLGNGLKAILSEFVILAFCQVSHTVDHLT